MSGKLTIKNNNNTEFTIEHKDGSNAKSIDSKDIAVAVDTINDFPSSPNDGDTVIVRNINNGSIYIYSSDNQGWIKQTTFYTKDNIDEGNVILDAIKRVDGPGSGLNADFLDGLNSSDFRRAWNFLNINTNAYINAQDFIKADTSGGAIILTLPSSPADNDQIVIWDIKGSFNTNNCTIDGNGKNVMGATTCVLDIDNKKYYIIYDDNSGEWRIA
jgi:hypothetical protein